MILSRLTMSVLLVAPCLLSAQEGPGMQRVMERLDRLEEQNRQMLEELRALRQELAAAKAVQQPDTGPPLEERVAIQEQRTAELAQTKVETSQKFPLKVTGMALFNAFINTRNNGGSENPVAASATPGPSTSGATLRQTVLGLTYDGPQTVGGAKVNGSLFVDFFAGGTQALNHLARIRIATLELNWKNSSLLVGQDKPIIAPREPESLAQVGVSPLTGAGNLWLWQPQARFEQRFHFSERSTLRAQAGLFQTSEQSNIVPATVAGTLERARPGWEGRLAWSYAIDDEKRIEIASGVHASATHVAGQSVPSRVYSVDWLVAPWKKIEFTGAFFKGENVAGLGSLRQGFTVRPNGSVIPIHATGGWAQLTYFATKRLTFHAYGGQEDDRDRDLLLGAIAKNQLYAINGMYQIAPNVLIGLEASQARTRYLGTGTPLHNHYDLALAYLF